VLEGVGQAGGDGRVKTRGGFNEAWLAMLRAPQAESHFVGCLCVGACRIGTDEIRGEIERILFSEEEWEKTREEAIRALGEIDSDTLVPTLLRLMGTTLLGTLAIEEILKITRRM